MKLISLKILSDFRNLKGVELKFNARSNTYVLIGNNGAGKSSILEALSSIFYTLFNGGSPVFEFCFTLAYDFDGHKVSIANKPGKALKMTIDKVEVDRTGIDPILPQRVICNYSGEEMRIKQRYYLPLWQQYERRLKTAAGMNPLRMVFVDKDLWKIILYVMIAQRARYESFDKFLTETLGIHTIDRIAMSINVEALEDWRENPVSFYMRRLAGRVQGDGTIAMADMNPDDDEALTMFNNLSSAQSLIKWLDIIFNGSVDSQYLSEGEKKMMVVLFILEVISDERSLVLLDEPDSHIHVARKPDIVRMFLDAVNRENVLTSHSPSLTASFKEKSIIMLDRTPDGHAQVVDADKQKIVAELTNGIWTLQEQNIFLASNKTVLVVEGKTDEPILEAALNSHKKAGRYLYMDFVYLPCNGASNIPTLVSKFKPKPGQMMIAFFDADGSGWDAIKEVMADGKNYPKDPFGKAKKKDNIWYTTYPVYKKGVENFNIEDYFPRSVFLKYIMSFKALTEVWTKDRLKRNMAKDCEKGLMTDKQLEKFSIVFDHIQEIMNAEAAGLDHI